MTNNQTRSKITIVSRHNTCSARSCNEVLHIYDSSHEPSLTSHCVFVLRGPRKRKLACGGSCAHWIGQPLSCPCSERHLGSSEFMSGLDNSKFPDTTVEEPVYSHSVLLQRSFDTEVPNPLPPAIFHWPQAQAFKVTLSPTVVVGHEE